MSAAFSLYFYPCGLSGLAAVEQLHEACQGYDNWLRLAFALSDGLGEAGRQIFDRLSQMNADYDTRECNRLYDNCMKGNKGGITIATFFQMARDLANVDLKEMARERGKKEERSLQKSLKCLKCLTVSPSHKMNNNCNKKDNILIYNNLDKTYNSTWDSGTVGHLGHLVLFSSLFSCLFLEVHVCHASCCCICKIFKNRGVKFAVVCLSENVWPFEKSL